MTRIDEVERAVARDQIKELFFGDPKDANDQIYELAPGGFKYMKTDKQGEEIEMVHVSYLRYECDEKLKVALADYCMGDKTLKLYAYRSYVRSLKACFRVMEGEMKKELENKDSKKDQLESDYEKLKEIFDVIIGNQEIIKKLAEEVKKEEELRNPESLRMKVYEDAKRKNPKGFITYLYDHLFFAESFGYKEQKAGELIHKSDEKGGLTLVGVHDSYVRDWEVSQKGVSKMMYPTPGDIGRSLVEARSESGSEKHSHMLKEFMRDSGTETYDGITKEKIYNKARKAEKRVIDGITIKVLESNGKGAYKLLI